MKNLRRTSIFKYLNTLIYVVIIQFCTANAEFTTSEGKTLSINYVGKKLYEINLDWDTIGKLSKEQILKALKGVDYFNIKLGPSKGLLYYFPKTHFDIMGFFQAPALILFIINPSGFINSPYLWLSSAYFVVKTVAVFAVIEEEKNMARCYLVAASSGINPFLGMIAERWILRENNFKIIQSHEGLRVSDIQFERYITAINRHLAEANL